MFDMVIFYAGITITFSEEQEGKITSQVSDISSCLPIYIKEIPQIDHTLDSASLNNSSIGPLTDDVIINNSSIGHSLMVFAEIYLVYRFAASKKCNIIFLDGSLSSSYA